MFVNDCTLVNYIDSATILNVQNNVRLRRRRSYYVHDVEKIYLLYIVLDAYYTKNIFNIICFTHVIITIII